jgi:putative addiction module component (TIGR02574 family)
MSAPEILEQIRRLPDNERREVAERVLEEFGGLDDELTPEQIAELDRRAEDALKNPGRGVSLEEFISEMRQKSASK